MARKKNIRNAAKRTVRRQISPQYLTPPTNEMEMPSNYQMSSRRTVPRLLWLLPLVLIILAAIVWKNKGLLVAATVNNQPLWRLSLEQRLDQRYGSQMLDEMINEQILKGEAAKKGVTVSDKEVNDKIAEIEKSLAGRITLADALSQQGMTMADFKNQVEIQLMIDKMTASSAGATDQEISDYIAKNKEMLTASDEAGLKAQARTAIIQNKKNQAFQKLFQDLKKSAKVVKFIWQSQEDIYTIEA